MDDLEYQDRLEIQKRKLEEIKTIPPKYTRKLILSGTILMVTQVLGIKAILKANGSQLNMGKELESVIKKLKLECNKRNIDIRTSSGLNSYALNKWYANAIKFIRPDLRKYLDQVIGGKNGLVVISEFTSPEVIAHEIGHASTGTFIEKVWATVMGLVVGLSTINSVVALLSMLGVLQGILKVRSKLLDKPDPRSITYMKYITRLPMIFTLLEEGRASIKGLILLKKCGADTKTMLSGTTTLLTAYGTYAGMALFKSVAMQSFEYLGVALAKVYYSKHVIEDESN